MLKITFNSFLLEMDPSELGSGAIDVSVRS
jgi:hypothetical protein